jgi:hypothetical protein
MSAITPEKQTSVSYRREQTSKRPPKVAQRSQALLRAPPLSWRNRIAQLLSFNSPWYLDEQHIPL